MSWLRISMVTGTLAVLLAVAGCDSAGSGGAAGADPTEATANPAVEISGTEDPGPAGPNQPSIQTASLPIGGGFSSDDVGREQCVNVNYLGQDESEIPDGVSISVTRISFDPAYFALGGSGCSQDRTSCQNTGFRFTRDGAGCELAVRVVGGENDDQAELSVDGRVWCGSVGPDECAEFAREMDGDAQPIQLTVFVLADSNGGETTSAPASTSG